MLTQLDLSKQCLILLAALNVLLVSWRVGQSAVPGVQSDILGMFHEAFPSYLIQSSEPSEPPSPQSYLGDDYPLHYPMGDLEDPVAMTLHESVHFTLNASDPVIAAEWESLASHPDGFGRTRLGPNHRLFVMTFYHQLHCIWKFQQALVDRSDPTASQHHVQHCLNYLRQTLLCDAAESVEEGNFMDKDFDQDRIGDTLVCQDWEKVYSVLDSAYAEWAQWSKQWN